MPEFLSLRYVLRLLLKKWWLIGLIALLSAGLGFWLSQNQPTVYESTVVLAVGRALDADQQQRRELQVSQMLALTYADLARRRTVLEPVANQFFLEGGWQHLRGQVHSRPIPDSSRFEVAVRAQTAAEATQLAEAIATEMMAQSPQAYQDEIPTVQYQLITKRLAELQQRIANGQAEAAEFQAQQDAATTNQDIQFYRLKAQQVQNKISQWQQSHDQLQAILRPSYLANAVWQVEAAQNNTHLLFPRTQLNIIVVALLGIFLGAGMTFALAHFQDSVESNDVLQAQLGWRALGDIGLLKRRKNPLNLINTLDPNDPIVEAYRMIRTNLQYAAVDNPAQVMMLTSALPGEGKSITAANLAIVMAQTGLRTVLVDANLRHPVQQYLFQTAGKGGLSALLQQADLAVVEHLVQTNVEHLRLLPTDPVNYPAELLGSPRMEQILTALRQQADIVILDTPAALTTADATALAGQVDGLVLVVEADKTGLAIVRQATTHLQRTRATMLGVILNRVSKQTLNHKLTRPISYRLGDLTN